MGYGYTIKRLEDNMSKAAGVDLPISFKQSIEICNYIRGNTLEKAKQKLEDAISMKKPIPFRKYNDGLGHKKGNMLSGRYPVKACNEILKLVKSAEANALFKGLNSKGLILYHLSPKKAAGAWHYGRQRRRQMKRCNLEIILKEVAFKSGIRNSLKQQSQVKKDSKQSSKPEEQSPKPEEQSPKSEEADTKVNNNTKTKSENKQETQETEKSSKPLKQENKEIKQNKEEIKTSSNEDKSSDQNKKIGKNEQK